MLMFAIFAGACGGGSSASQVDSGSAGADLSGSADVVCVVDQDCSAGFPRCVYAVSAGCAAVGHCAHPDATPGATIELCGCDGQAVQTTTHLYAGGDGYADAPTTGEPYSSGCGGDGGKSSDGGN